MNEMILWVLLAAVIVLVALLIRAHAGKRTNTALRDEVAGQFRALSGMLSDMAIKTSQTNTQVIGALDASVQQRLGRIEQTVDQKLDATLKTGLDSSFRRVSEQLGQVYKSMGEVHALTADIGDLKSILAGVKTRGIFGEIQLGNLLSDFLAPGQYMENAHIGEGGIVEFAVILPGENEQSTLLPIDAKFPMDRYARVLKHMETGNTDKLKEARKELVAAILLEAKKINEKYIRPPQTTDHAILFLPSESLYMEAIRLGLLEKLHSQWNVVLSGPSTFSALLTSMQAGFRAVRAAKHSSAVLDMLAAIRRDFEQFAQTIEKAQGSLSAAQNHLGSLQKHAGKIKHKLSEVDSFPV
ncbi:MAG: DNA recombination protein RmuC [Christensenellaceae bacterium]|jgi:DNA recombination protein RmuC